MERLDGKAAATQQTKILSPSPASQPVHHSDIEMEVDRGEDDEAAIKVKIEEEKIILEFHKERGDDASAAASAATIKRLMQVSFL